MRSPFKQVSFADVVHYVCKRPAMYTMHGSFPEVIAYIEGYTTSDTTRKSRLEWHGFSRWLSARMDYQDDKVAARYLRETYPNDDEAISRLAELYSEYADHEKSQKDLN